MVATEYNWLIPSRIGLLKFEGDLSITELGESHVQLFNRFLNPGTKPVHIIVDIERMGSFPTNFLQMQQMNRELLTHPALGWLVVVGSKNVVQRFLVSSISQIFQARVKMLTTVEEALTTLKKLDSTLP